MITPGAVSFQLSFQISPIILTGGVAGNIAGGQLPIISLTQGNIYTTLLSGGTDLSLDDFFAQFMPLPGATLADNQVAVYPFANQQTAANAIVTQPLRVSMAMICPVRPPGGYAEKLAVLSSLQATLAQHDISGGTYTVVTPSFVYTNCIRTRWEDISNGESKQPQVMWRFDFEQPLITLQQAAGAQNNLMGKISSGTQINGTPNWSGAAPTVGNPGSGVAPSVVPATTPLTGSSTDPGPLARGPLGTTTVFDNGNQDFQGGTPGAGFVPPNTTLT